MALERQIGCYPPSVPEELSQRFVINVGDSGFSIVSSNSSEEHETLILDAAGEEYELLCTPTDLHYCFQFEREMQLRFKEMRMNHAEITLLLRNKNSREASEVRIHTNIMEHYSPDHKTNYGIVVAPQEYSGLLVSQICGSWVVVRPFMIRRSESGYKREQLEDFSQKLLPDHVSDLPRAFYGGRNKYVNLRLSDDDLSTGMCFSFQEVQGSFQKIGTVDFGQQHRILHNLSMKVDFYDSLPCAYVFTPFPSIDSPVFSNWENTENSNVGYGILHRVELDIRDDKVFINNPPEACTRDIANTSTRVTYPLWLPKENQSVKDLNDLRMQYKIKAAQARRSELW